MAHAILNYEFAQLFEPSIFAYSFLLERLHKCQIGVLTVLSQELHSGTTAVRLENPWLGLPQGITVYRHEKSRADIKDPDVRQVCELHMR